MQHRHWFRLTAASTSALGQLEPFAGGATHVRSWGQSGSNRTKSGPRRSNVGSRGQTGRTGGMARTAALSRGCQKTLQVFVHFHGRVAARFSNGSKNGRRTELLGIYFFLSFFSFRFSFGLSWAFFCCSFLPLSFFPLSPILGSPCLNRDSPDGSSHVADNDSTRGERLAAPESVQGQMRSFGGVAGQVRECPLSEV